MQHGHDPADVTSAFNAMHRLNRDLGNGRTSLGALGDVVTKWNSVCDQLGAGSTVATGLVGLLIQAHGIRALQGDKLAAFEEEFSAKVQQDIRNDPGVLTLTLASARGVELCDICFAVAVVSNCPTNIS